MVNCSTPLNAAQCTDDKFDDSKRIASIVGGAVGVVLVIVLVGIGLAWLYRKRQRAKRRAKEFATYGNGYAGAAGGPSRGQCNLSVTSDFYDMDDLGSLDNDNFLRSLESAAFSNLYPSFPSYETTGTIAVTTNSQQLAQPHLRPQQSNGSPLRRRVLREPSSTSGVELPLSVSCSISTLTSVLPSLCASPVPTQSSGPTTEMSVVHRGPAVISGGSLGTLSGAVICTNEAGDSRTSLDSSRATVEGSPTNEITAPHQPHLSVPATVGARASSGGRHVKSASSTPTIAPTSRLSLEEDPINQRPVITRQHQTFAVSRAYPPLAIAPH